MAWDYVRPADASESASSIHGEGERKELLKALLAPVPTGIHCADDRGELLEVLLLRGQQRRGLEERDDTLEQVDALSHDEHDRSVSASVRLDVAAIAKPPADDLQHLSPVAVLADMEFGYQLIAGLARRIPVYDDREASFSIDVTRDVAIQPFLLIVRTRHIVTVPSGSDDPRCTGSAGYTEFPAYSQIYRQQGLLSHDVLNPARVPL